MTSLSILWTLLFLATVRARSEVSITDAALETENSWRGVPASDDEENALKTDVNSQSNADIEDSILSRIGLDALAQSVGSRKLSEGDSVDLEKALDEKLQDISDTLSRLSGMDPNEISDTNYDNLANLKISQADSDEVYKDQRNMKDDNVLSILDGGADDVSVWNGPNRDNRLNVLSRNGHNLNPFSGLHSRSGHQRSLIPGIGYNKRNINEKDGTSFTDQNVDSDVILKRKAALNGVRERKSNDVNNLLLAKNTGPNTVFRRNDLLDISKAGSVRRLIDTPWHSKNDLENVKINVDHGKATIEEIISNWRSLVNSDKVDRNIENFNALKRLPLNDLEPNASDGRNLNSDIDAELASIIVNVRAGSNKMNEFNKISSLDDNSNDVNVLDHLSRHGIQNNRHGISKLGIKDLNQVKNELKILDYNKLNTKTGRIDVDRELASIIANVRASGDDLNELNKINNLYDDSYDVNVIDHLSKHGLVTNRNGIKKVSLNDLNDAKRLLGPLSVDKVTIADRVSNEEDGALLNALNTEDDLNALGALFVLNKAAEATEKLNSLELNKINSRRDIDIESNMLSKLGAPEDSVINGITSNPLKKVLNSLVSSRIDSTNGVESDVNSEYSPENLSRSQKNLLHSLVGSKLNTKLENKIPEAQVDDVNSLLSRISNRLSKNILRKLLKESKKTHRQYKGYRPSSQYNNPSYLYRPRLDNGLDKNDNLSDLVELSRIAKLSDINDNIPIVSERGEENEYSLDDLLSVLDINAVSDISADLSKSQLKNLIALRNHALDHVHGKNQLNHVSDVDDEKSVRLAVSKLDKDLRDAKNLILAGGLGNLKDQRRMISGKSNLKLLSDEEENKYDNVVLVPVRVDSSAGAKRAVGPYDISDLIDLDHID